MGLRNFWTGVWTLDLAFVAYCYQDKAAALPRSFSKSEREHKPIIGATEIHKWHDVWRVDKDEKRQLWGMEK